MFVVLLSDNNPILSIVIAVVIFTDVAVELIY